jgi:hypothetical protein
MTSFAVESTTLVVVPYTPGQDWISDSRRSSEPVLSVRTFSRCDPCPVTE